MVQFIANMNFSLNIRIMTRPFYEYFPKKMKIKYFPDIWHPKCEPKNTSAMTMITWIRGCMPRRLLVVMTMRNDDEYNNKHRPCLDSRAI